MCGAPTKCLAVSEKILLRCFIEVTSTEFNTHTQLTDVHLSSCGCPVSACQPQLGSRKHRGFEQERMGFPGQVAVQTSPHSLAGLGSQAAGPFCSCESPFQLLFQLQKSCWDQVTFG